MKMYHCSTGLRRGNGIGNNFVRRDRQIGSHARRMDGAGNCACDYDFAHTGSFVFFTRLMAFSGLRALLVPSIGPRRHSALWSTKDGWD